MDHGDVSEQKRDPSFLSTQMRVLRPLRWRGLRDVNRGRSRGSAFERDDFSAGRGRWPLLGGCRGFDGPALTTKRGAARQIPRPDFSWLGCGLPLDAERNHTTSQLAAGNGHAAPGHLLELGIILRHHRAVRENDVDAAVADQDAADVNVLVKAPDRTGRSLDNGTR
jgi:hypothetical protein